MRVFDMHLYKYDIDVFTIPLSAGVRCVDCQMCVLAARLAASVTDPQSGDAGRSLLLSAPAKCDAT